MIMPMPGMPSIVSEVDGPVAGQDWLATQAETSIIVIFKSSSLSS